MIASLAGILADKSAERVIVDVAGVGYAVHVSLQTFADLPACGAAVRLLVHTEVREDAIELFGFLRADEQSLFHLLRRVKGVGPRTSLTVLSGMPAPALAAIIAAGDVARLQSIPGIGRKLAERIVVECREAAGLLAAGTRPSQAAKPGDGVSAEAVSALVNLGYSRVEAERAVDKASTPGMPLERLLRNALQGLGG